MGLSAGRYGGGRYARLRRAGGHSGDTAEIQRGTGVRISQARIYQIRSIYTPHRPGAYHGIGIANVKECSIKQGSICSMFPRDINRVAP